MNVIIARTKGVCTYGSLLVFDGNKKLFEGKTIELPDKGNQKEISCIPEGIYDLIKTKSEKFGDAFVVANVPNRTAIMMHVGNYAAGKQIDTHGCILPGLAFADLNKDGIQDVVQSTDAMKKLNDILPQISKLYVI
jgi:hypothetical protein